MASIANIGWNLKPLFKKYQQQQISHFCDSLGLLAAILSETSVL